MDDLISRSALLAEMGLDEPISVDEKIPEIKGMWIEWKHWMKKIKRFPAIDAVPVVRCGECEKRKTTECALSYFVFDDFDVEVRFLDVPDAFYCPYGERKENETN